MRKLISLVHGYSKSGKSWTQMTMPGPRLVLDAEGRTEYTPTHKVVWDPSQPPPTGLESSDTCLVKIRTWGQVQQVGQWLASQQHPFRSMSLDSLQELQALIKREILNGEDRSPKIEEWGQLLRKGETFLRALRDMLRLDGQPLECILVLCGTEDKDGRKVPLLDGALQKSVSYPFDVVGYLYRPASGEASIPTLRIGPLDGFECGDGTDLLSKHYGPSIINPNFTEMLSVLNQEALVNA